MWVFVENCVTFNYNTKTLWNSINSLITFFAVKREVENHICENTYLPHCSYIDTDKLLSISKE